MSNVYDPTRQVSVGRGNCSFTSLNLVRYAIDAVRSSNSVEVAEKKFYGAIIGKAYYTGAIDLAEALEVAK